MYNEQPKVFSLKPEESRPYTIQSVNGAPTIVYADTGRADPATPQRKGS